MLPWGFSMSLPDELAKLAELRLAGLLTDDEYAAAKRHLLEPPEDVPDAEPVLDAEPAVAAPAPSPPTGARRSVGRRHRPVAGRDVGSVLEGALPAGVVGRADCARGVQPVLGVRVSRGVGRGEPGRAEPSHPADTRRTSPTPAPRRPGCGTPPTGGRDEAGAARCRERTPPAGPGLRGVSPRAATPSWPGPRQYLARTLIIGAPGDRRVRRRRVGDGQPGIAVRLLARREGGTRGLGPGGREFGLARLPVRKPLRRLERPPARRGHKVPDLPATDAGDETHLPRVVLAARLGPHEVEQLVRHSSPVPLGFGHRPVFVGHPHDSEQERKTRSIRSAAAVAKYHPLSTRNLVRRLDASGQDPA